MYGSSAARRASAETGATGQATTSPNTTQPYDGKDHGITRQILNPDGNKYEEQKFGTTTSGESGAVGSTTATQDGKDHGIMRQILNPDGEKYDEKRHGTTTNADPLATHSPREQEPTLESRMGEPKEDRSVQRKVL